MSDQHAGSNAIGQRLRKRIVRDLSEVPERRR